MDDINNTTSSSDQRLLLDQQFKLVVELVDKVYTKSILGTKYKIKNHSKI